MNVPKNFLPPVLSGIGLGLTLLATFLLIAHGLGASGAFKNSAAQFSHIIATEWTAQTPFFARLLEKFPHLSDAWIIWEIIGVALGALLASLLFRRFRFKIERGTALSVSNRLVYALLGGVLTGFGSALAQGCSSGLGLSGGAVLAVGAFIFLMSFFAAGLLLALYTKRYWL